ncbi:MAG: hypothetical protein ACE5ET_01890 [Gammaproteobacteria bacterium]
MPDLKRKTLSQGGRRLMFITGGKSADAPLLPSIAVSRNVAESDRKLVEQIFAGFAWHG